MKTKAKILDAGCGNRTMWEIKDSPFILYVDKEQELSYKPDETLDITNSGLKENRFHLIFFDPPHDYGRSKNTAMFTVPDRELFNEKWPDYARKGHPRYYGADKYKTKSDLMEYVFQAQKEFYRIGSEDCILMLKWSENRLTIKEILQCFTLWGPFMKIPVKTSHQSAKDTYWVILMKNQGPKQISL